MSYIPQEYRATSSILKFRSSTNESIQTLGLPWHTDADTLSIQYKSSSKLKDKHFIKRLVLSAIASIFDPLGLISPIVTPFKFFMQVLWASKINWDKPLSNELLDDWLKIWND